MELLVRVNDDNFTKLKLVSDILKDSVKVQVPVDELCSKAINDFIANSNHIEVMGLTSKFKLSVAEVLKHGVLGDIEKDCLEYLYNSKYRNERVNVLIYLIISEYHMNNSLTEVNGEHPMVGDLVKILLEQYDIRYGATRFKSGFKRYCIKITLFRLIFSDNNF